MAYDHHNLVQHTVHAHPRYETLRCEVGSKPSAWSAYLDWNWYHHWPDGDRKHGRCLNCGKTLAQVRIRIDPKRGVPVRRPAIPEGSAAHLERALRSGE